MTAAAFAPTFALAAMLLGGGAPPALPKLPGQAEILAAAPASDWRTVDPANTLYLDLPSGRVIIELAPAFAPNHVANIRALSRDGWFDGAAIVRVQDNYVTQWGRPEGDTFQPKTGKRALKAEFDRADAANLMVRPAPDPDTYAETGWSQGFPMARGGGRAWLTHCYGMVGAGRDLDADTGGGGELYAVNGQAPRQLDRNVTLVGRVLEGMERLSALPRGTGMMGFYETTAEHTPVGRARIAADLPENERVPLEALRTDSETFGKLVAYRRHREDAFYKRPADRIDVCNVPLPVRRAK